MHPFSQSVPAGELAVFLGRAVIALLLGGLIGAERQWRSRMAGLRTNALVALGAALFELLSLLLAVSPTASLEHGAVDFTRVTAYIVSGVGFLGAGVIIRDGVNVRGINTAATIWCSAAVGALCGTGYLLPATIGALAVVVGHVALRPVARRIDRRPADQATEVETAYRFEAVCAAAEEAHVRVLLTQAISGSDFRLRAVLSEDLDHGSGRVKVTADLVGSGRDDVALEAAVSRLSLEPAVAAVSWRVADDRRLEDLDG
ncbi:MgtC/SapB family protein [Aciditerrimonas ferrireducens]|jgi:putative Mg2+ transporter-C (MgtC) family protein|uniref:MgtC/SapB family protein n=1 Tax=Aciditerrimonas ferrireducens TaxID=667306 RepID=A0ABV6BZ97_9ACTN|nr:MgtC/SapB family protein [Aciditerrimonas ferrireducens]MCK4177268.1 MgtC/SapB family protein [Aciditerrimonas ferrireducens]